MAEDEEPSDDGERRTEPPDDVGPADPQRDDADVGEPPPTGEPPDEPPPADRTPQDGPPADGRGQPPGDAPPGDRQPPGDGQPPREGRGPGDGSPPEGGPPGEPQAPPGDQPGEPSPRGAPGEPDPPPGDQPGGPPPRGAPEGGQNPPRGQQPAGGHGAPSPQGQGAGSAPPQGPGRGPQGRGRPVEQGPSTMDEVTAALQEPETKGFVVLAAAMGGIFAGTVFVQILFVDELLGGGPITALSAFAYAFAAGIGLYFGRVRDVDEVTAYTASAAAALVSGTLVVLVGNVAVAVREEPTAGDVVVGLVIAAVLCLGAGLAAGVLARRLDPEDLFEPSPPSPRQAPPPQSADAGGPPANRRGPG